MALLPGTVEAVSSMSQLSAAAATTLPMSLLADTPLDGLAAFENSPLILLLPIIAIRLKPLSFSNQ